MPLRDLAIRSLRGDSKALAAAARRDPAARIPTCPAWSEHELVHHMGRMHRWVLHILDERVTEPIWPNALPGGPEEPAERLQWFEEGAELLAAAFERIPDDAQVWNWAQGVAGPEFWMKRVALETAVHRVDAEGGTGGILSGGTPPTPLQPVDPELGVIGVDEMAEVFLPLMRDKVLKVSNDGTSIHLHCTDTPGEWLFRFGPDGVTTSREHAKGDVAVRGSASDLYLLLWNRVAADRCEVFGDASLLGRFAEHVRV